MTLLVALLISSSFIHDGIRAYILRTIHQLEPKTTSREGRNLRYRPFTLHRLPPLTTTTATFPTDDQTAVQRTLTTFHQAFLWFIHVTGTHQLLQPFILYYQRIYTHTLQPYLPAFFSTTSTTVRAFPALDTLPFPAPSLTRRCLAWTIDSCLVYFLTSSFKGTGLRSTLAGLLWVTRDLWLSGWGHQSIGRYLMNQCVLHTDLCHHLHRQCATHEKTPSLHPFEMDPSWHEKDIHASLTYNALRLFLNVLGPLSMLTWVTTSLPPALYGNGRTLWDRWTHMQVVDLEVFHAWEQSGKIDHPNAKPLWESEVIETIK
ncbi:hypothetical protein HMI54_009373 [Coelomomyces lativittatus]|nr:hypothetical protein HMI55_004091 [Coelomomyces lativittatus]KAJ1506323.1 hypothetical protein HMI56_000666 [Coelomomyces lativittatus]KAJ1516442.1 hypothetical protein HMI54_009373 [Coelomomyces lativittatus]